jgi:5-methylcytosine-specific restriction endonuclease McrA
MVGRATILIWAFVVASPVACADYLEVRRAARIYEEPNSKSDVLAEVDKAGPGEIRILHIAHEDPIENGYLKVRLTEGPGYGYIYRTAGRVYSDFDGPYIPYDRKLYKHWIDENKDCRDTRVEVLIRDAIPGTVEEGRKGSKCIVTAGRWEDPYTGQTLTDPKALDVDHVVPLKNAHESGAWAWSAERKREYANDLRHPEHLLAVSARENRKKGDKGPDRYLPPNQSDECHYVENFLRIKEVWGLDVTEDEENAAAAVLNGCGE